MKFDMDEPSEEISEETSEIMAIMNEHNNSMILVYCELVKLQSRAGLPGQIGLSFRFCLRICLIKISILRVIKVTNIIFSRS